MSIVDDIAKKLEELKKQIKCAINVIGKVVSGSDLEKKYLEFKAAVNAVLTKDVKECGQAQGLKEKLRYDFSVIFMILSIKMNVTHLQMLRRSFQKACSTIQRFH